MTQKEINEGKLNEIFNNKLPKFVIEFSKHDRNFNYEFGKINEKQYESFLEKENGDYIINNLYFLNNSSRFQSIKKYTYKLISNKTSIYIYVNKCDTLGDYIIKLPLNKIIIKL